MRSIWFGALSFGLINIPVKIFSASEESGLDFRMLEKHGHCPISYMKVCRTTNIEVRSEVIVKGYEYLNEELWFPNFEEKMIYKKRLNFSRKK